MCFEACCMTFLCSAHTRTDCDIMCKPPAYKTMHTVLIVCNVTDQYKGVE